MWQTIWRHAGVLGVWPDPYTYGELADWAGGLIDQQWWVAAWQLAHLMDVHRDKKQRRRPFAAAEFHPLELARAEAKRKQVVDTVPVSLLKTLFVKKR